MTTEIAYWSARPLAPHDVAIPVDAAHVKVRDGQVSDGPFYAAIGVDLRGRCDVLGLWAGTPGRGESSTCWVGLEAELTNPRRGRHPLPRLRRTDGHV